MWSSRSEFYLFTFFSEVKKKLMSSAASVSTFQQLNIEIRYSYCNERFLARKYNWEALEMYSNPFSASREMDESPLQYFPSIRPCVGNQ